MMSASTCAYFFALRTQIQITQCSISVDFGNAIITNKEVVKISELVTDGEKINIKERNLIAFTMLASESLHLFELVL